MSRRFGRTHVVALAAAALLLTACGSAQDVVTASDDDGTSPPQASPTATTPTDSSTTESTQSTRPTESTPTETTPTKTTPPKPKLAGRPKVGTCYDSSRRAFTRQRDGSFPVRCRQRHTAETFAVLSVGTLPKPADLDQVWRRCQPRFKAYVGGSPTISRLGLTVILPSSDQSAAGQGWVRCDAIEQPSYNGNRGLPRRGSVKGVLSGGVPPQYRGCALHWPKVDQPVHFTSCQRRHQAELIPESLTLGAPDAKFPGFSTSKNRSQQFCESTFQDYVPETRNYYYYYPTSASWKSGSHDTTCWALDTRGDGLPPI